MTTTGVAHVLVLGGGFAGLAAAQEIRKRARKRVAISLMDRRSYLVYVPNIASEVFANNNPMQSMRMPLVAVLEEDGVDFIQAEATAIDLDGRRVLYQPTERNGGAQGSTSYDFLVVALGAQLAYDRIPGFARHGHAVSDTFSGNRLRRYLSDASYQGGPIAVGSARFHQGTRGRPEWLPTADVACEEPVIETALGLLTWLQGQELASQVTLFSPGESLAPDAGLRAAQALLQFGEERGLRYRANVGDVSRLTPEGIQFASGENLEAEFSILVPDWVPAPLLQGLPVADEMGFVVTGESMRCPDFPDVFACGDCAALTVPKLAGIGRAQAEIVARQIAREVGAPSSEEEMEIRPRVVYLGDMGADQGFYIHSDVWFGGQTEVLRIGRIPRILKRSYRDMFFANGGKIPGWGVPFGEWAAEHLGT
jgi:sulfide:quinone oxidoreductase